MLAADGTLDMTFSGGVHTFAFGNDGADQLWGGATNRGTVLLAGYKGVGPIQTADDNDDAYVALFGDSDTLFRNGFGD